MPQTVRPRTSSQEKLPNLIKTEVASLLAPYERLLEEAKAATAGKDTEIANLRVKKELAAAKARVKSSAVPAACRCRLQTRNASRGRTTGGRCNGNSEI